MNKTTMIQNQNAMSTEIFHVESLDNWVCPTVRGSMPRNCPANGDRGYNVSINMYSSEGAFIRSFRSAKEASILTGVSRAGISLVLNGHAQAAKGYRFEYAKP